MKMTAFWDRAPCSLIEVDQRFKGVYFLRHQYYEEEGAVHTSETSVCCNETKRCYIPEGCLLQYEYNSCIRALTFSVTVIVHGLATSDIFNNILVFR
jgi:hypothetical protein